MGEFIHCNCVWLGPRFVQTSVISTLPCAAGRGKLQSAKWAADVAAVRTLVDCNYGHLEVRDSDA